MKRNNGERVISTDDIFISAENSNLGKNLDQVLKEQHDDISELKSNIKYIYRHGTMGGGSGNGSSDVAFRVSATISSPDGTFSKAITNNEILSLNGSGQYNLTITISKGQGHSFSVSYALGNNTPVALSSTTNIYTTVLNIQEKQAITINVSDNTTEDAFTLTSVIIPVAYKITSQVLYQGSELSGNNGAYAPQVINGASLNINYTINTQDLLYYVVRYKLDTQEEYTLLTDSDTPHFPIPASASESLSEALDPIYLNTDFTAENTGGTITLQILCDYNKNPTTVISEYKFNIISNDLYILLTSQNGTLTNTMNDSTSYHPDKEFNIGYLPVLLTVYNGPNDQGNSSFNVTIDLKELINEQWTTPSEFQPVSALVRTRRQQNLSANPFLIRINEGGIYKLTASTQGTQTTKYFKVSASNNTFSFNEYGIDHTTIQKANYYENLTSPFISQAFILYDNSYTKELANIPQSTELFITNIALGLQYSKSNNPNSVIARIYKFSGDYLEITQSKVAYYSSVGVQMWSITYYMPKQDNIDVSSKEWHLFNLNFNLIKNDEINTVTGYEANIYIDGKLDGTYTGTEYYTLLSDSFVFNKVILNPDYTANRCNIAVNLFDITYYTKTTDFFKNPDGSITSDSVGSNQSLWDEYADLYYYTYKQHYDSSYNEEYNKLIISSFKYNKYAIPYLTNDEMQNLLQGSSIKVPILVLQPGTYNPPAQSQLIVQDFFTDWFLRKWSETTATGSFNTKVYYINSKSTTVVSDYLINESLIGGTNSTSKDAITFQISIQGSSTRGFGAKNLTLAIVQPNDYTTRVFTPNYTKTNTNSMLPETSFNLKADQMDSSHCNNNAIGDFVNQMQSSIGGNDNHARLDKDYGDHVKNCLTGFPCLVFIAYGNGSIDSCNYYYLGIYNFNMSRNAYFNLGYYYNEDTNKAFPTEFEYLNEDGSNTFQVIDYPSNELTLDKDLVVGEISTGLPYFDFSQFDSSVLFDNDATENRGMFSDMVYNSYPEATSSIQSFMESVAKAGGYIFKQLGKNFVVIKPDNGDAVFPYQRGNTETSFNEVSDYHIQYSRQENTYTQKSQKLQDATIDDLINCIQNTNANGDTNQQKVLDLTSAVEYFVIVMCFGMVDSVLKNLEIKRWGNTFYIAFYDMDTALDRDNAGKEISYFVFSDYWKINNKYNEITGKYDVNSASIYPDYFDTSTKGVTGFDIPSSYLFAIAKYAYSDVVFESVDQSQSPKITGSYKGINYEMTPVNVYAKYRLGPLKNAQTFMQTYFNRLSNIPNYLINLNYRAKYLRTYLWGYSQLMPGTLEGDGATLSSDIAKFSGTEYYRKQDWLESRLRLLDAYFNINSEVSYPVQKYANPNSTTFSESDQNNQWITLTKQGNSGIMEYHYPKVLNAFTSELQKNNDVKVLQSILGTDTKSQITNGYVDITAPQYSPFIFSPNAGTYISYMIGGYDSQGNDYVYRFTPNVQTNQQWYLYGSSFWNTVSDLGVFRLTSYTINSDKLKDLNFLSTQRYGIYCNGGITLGNTPAVENITINGQYYSGALNLNGNNTKINLPRLISIDLTGSNIILSDNNAQSLGVKTLLLDNVNSGSISVGTWTKLTNVSMNNATIDSLSIVAWKKDLSIYGNNYTGTCDAKNVKITSLTLQAKIPDSSIEILNMSSLAILHLVGFKTVRVVNCTNLSKLQIENGIDSITSLQIQQCSQNSQSLSTNMQANDNIIDLSLLNSLEILSLKQTYGFETLILPNKTLSLDSFNYGSHNNKFKYIKGSGTYNMTSANAFTNAAQFTFKQSADGNYCNVKLTGTSLSNDFMSTNVDMAACKYIITNAVVNPSQVTSINGMFNFTSLKVSSIKEFQNSDGSSIFKNYTSVTNADDLFNNTGINLITKELYSFGARGISCNNIISGSGVLQMAADTFSHVNKCSSITFTCIGRTPAFIVVDQYLGTSSNISDLIANSSHITWNSLILKNYLPNDPNKVLKTLQGLDIIALNIDCTNAFTNLTGLTTIGSMFCHGANGVNIKYNNTASLFYPLKDLRNVSRLWYNQGITIDLDTFFADKFYQYGQFTFDGTNGNTYRSYYVPQTFDVNKTITLTGFDKIMSLLSKNNNSNINYIFRNCKVTDVTSARKNIVLSNNNWKDISFLFENCKFYLDDVEVPMDISITNPNLRWLRQTFSKCYIYRLKANFFNKISSYTISDNIYSVLRTEDDITYLQKDSLTQLRYNSNQIMNLYHTFYNSYFEIPYYDNSDTILQASLASGKDTYYTSASQDDNGNYYAGTYDTEHAIQNNASNDLIFEGAQIIQNINYGDVSGQNPSLIGINPESNLIIPPDFFYDVSSSALVEGCFACSNDIQGNRLQGVIPQHIFSRCQNILPPHVFQNNYVIPSFIKEISGVSYYSFVPANYSTNTNMDNAFDFYLLLPNYQAEDRHQYFYIIQNSSISDSIQTMHNAMPNTIDSLNQINTQSIGTFNCYLGLACSITQDTITDGLNVQSKRNLYLSSLVSLQMSYFMRGHIFNEDFVLGSDRLENNTRVIQTVGSNGMATANFICRNIILPRLSEKFDTCLFPNNQIVITNNEKLGEASQYQA